MGRTAAPDRLGSVPNVIQGGKRLGEGGREGVGRGGRSPRRRAAPASVRPMAGRRSVGHRARAGSAAPPARCEDDGGLGRATSGGRTRCGNGGAGTRSEEHTSELQSLMRISYAVFCL